MSRLVFAQSIVILGDRVMPKLLVVDGLQIDGFLSQSNAFFPSAIVGHPLAQTAKHIGIVGLNRQRTNHHGFQPLHITATGITKCEPLVDSTVSAIGQRLGSICRCNCARR